MEAASQGEDEGRRELWEWALANLPTLKAIARRHGGGEHDTSSLVNSFLARLFSQKTAALRRIRTRTAYAAQGLKNLVLARRRRRPNQPLVAEPPAPSVDDAERQIEHERRVVFKRGWDELAPDERQLIEAKVFSQMSSDQVADELGITAEAVRKRQEKVRDKLQAGVALLWAAEENGWAPGTIHYRLVCLRHFRCLSMEAIEGELGWTRGQVATWLDRTRAQLPGELRGLL